MVLFLQTGFALVTCDIHLQVRNVGGLRVILAALQDSERSTLQLQGRAGRQGDPGETFTLIDIYDRLLPPKFATQLVGMITAADQTFGTHLLLSNLAIRIFAAAMLGSDSHGLPGV